MGTTIRKRAATRSFFTVMSSTKKGFIITIDGPAGAGKSTVSKRLAEVLDGRLLDTGATYRALAYYAMKSGIEDENELSKIARGLNFRPDKTGLRTLVNGEDLGRKLRTERVSANASAYSRFAGVRKILTQKQRKLGRELSRKFPVVVEGRDIGTVVFPKERFKFYITANEDERAQRRYLQLKAGGAKITYREVLKKVRDRDRQDSTRKHAPLRRPKDSILIDTSELGVADVVNKLKGYIYALREKRLK